MTELKMIINKERLEELLWEIYDLSGGKEFDFINMAKEEIDIIKLDDKYLESVFNFIVEYTEC